MSLLADALGDPATSQRAVRVPRSIGAADGDDAEVTDDRPICAARLRIERELLGGERRYTRLRGRRARRRLDRAHAQELWRALGFADVDDDVAAFTDRDAWALRTVDRARRSRAGSTTSMQVVDGAGTRSVAGAPGRLAACRDRLDGRPGDRRPTQAMRRAEELVPVVEELIGYVWRRHLAAAAGRALAVERDEFAAGRWRSASPTWSGSRA